MNFIFHKYSTWIITYDSSPLLIMAQLVQSIFKQHLFMLIYNIYMTYIFNCMNKYCFTPHPQYYSYFPWLSSRYFSFLFDTEGRHHNTLKRREVISRLSRPWKEELTVEEIHRNHHHYLQWSYLILSSSVLDFKAPCTPILKEIYFKVPHIYK